MNKTLRWVLFLATLRGIHTVATKGLPPASDLAVLAVAIAGAIIAYHALKRTERIAPPDLTEQEHTT